MITWLAKSPAFDPPPVHCFFFFFFPGSNLEVPSLSPRSCYVKCYLCVLLDRSFDFIFIFRKHGQGCWSRGERFVSPAVVSPGMYYEVGELLKFDIEAYGVYKHVTPGPLLLLRLFRILFSDLTGG